jgi:hypothetical protein
MQERAEISENFFPNTVGVIDSQMTMEGESGIKRNTPSGNCIVVGGQLASTASSLTLKGFASIAENVMQNGCAVEVNNYNRLTTSMSIEGNAAVKGNRNRNLTITDGGIGTPSGGAGVSCLRGGELALSGANAEISGNITEVGTGGGSYQGGGVQLWFGGTFTMSAGKVSGNALPSGKASKGGGVYVVGGADGSVFTQIGGIVYGGTAGVLSNTADSGNTVYVDDSSSETNSNSIAGIYN